MTADFRKATSQELFRRWQQRWDNSRKYRWTHKLIPCIERCVEHSSLQDTVNTGITCITSDWKAEASKAGLNRTGVNENPLREIMLHGGRSPAGIWEKDSVWI